MYLSIKLYIHLFIYLSIYETNVHLVLFLPMNVFIYHHLICTINLFTYPSIK